MVWFIEGLKEGDSKYVAGFFGGFIFFVRAHFSLLKKNCFKREKIWFGSGSNKFCLEKASPTFFFKIEKKLSSVSAFSVENVEKSDVERRLMSIMVMWRCKVDFPVWLKAISTKGKSVRLWFSVLQELSLAFWRFGVKLIRMKVLAPPCLEHSSPKRSLLLLPNFETIHRFRREFRTEAQKLNLQLDLKYGLFDFHQNQLLAAKYALREDSSSFKISTSYDQNAFKEHLFTAVCTWLLGCFNMQCYVMQLRIIWLG